MVTDSVSDPPGREASATVYRASYSIGRMLSDIPPSTAITVRPSPRVRRSPTRYSVTPALPDDAPAGLGRQRRHGETALAARHPQAPLRRRPHLRHRGRPLVRVRDAEPAAHVEHVDGDPVLLAQPRGQRHQHVELAQERLGGEDLGADVRVETEEAEVRERGRRRDRLGHGGRRDPERRRLVAGRDRLMGVHTQAGVHAEQERLHHARRAGDAVQPPELVRTVGDHQPHASSNGELQLVIGLVPPVERDPGGRDAGAQAGFDLAAARGEQVEPFVDRQPEHRVRRERLDGVERLRERQPCRSQPGGQIRLVEHQQRGGESVGESDGALPRDPHAVGLERRVHRPWIGNCRDLGRRFGGPERRRPLSHRPGP